MNSGTLRAPQTKCSVPRSRARHPVARSRRLAPLDIGAQMFVITKVRLVTALILGAFTIPGALHAQTFPGFGGIGIRAGAVSPDDAKAGFGMSADLDLGYLRVPLVRTILGFNYFNADVDRQVGGSPVGGSMTVTGGSLGLRLDLLAGARFSPYLGAAILGQSLSADVTDAGTKDLLEGFYFGAGISGGFAFALDSARRIAVTGEARRGFANNASHTGFEVGFRFSPRGTMMYSNVAAERRRALREEELRLEREREAARLASERALAQRDSAAAAQARQDAERLRAEQERQEAERIARERAAQEQQDRQTAAQQRQAQSQAEIDRLRRTADSLRAAQAAEAAARVGAEAEAAAARARAMTADSAARAADARAADAERRRYEALLDLNRLISNVTEIRETERGLAVVLGQGLFASGQFALSPQARSEVGTIAAVLAQYQDNRIAVEGHTDSVGSEVANQRLSERRAEAVRAALIGRGIAPSRIEMAGFGQGRAIGDNSTAEGRAQNRRVEIIVLGARRPGGG